MTIRRDIAGGPSRRFSFSRRTLVAGAAVLGLCAVAAGVAVFQFYDPNAVGNPFPPCLFKTVTGLDCIGCGVTRALHALAHGDLMRAFEMNPLAVLVLPLMPLMLLDTFGWRPAALQPLMRIVMRAQLWMVLLPVYWVARNLPWWPFSWLAAG